ncbi:MAG: PilZ domain-containing protein [Candidatus Tectimicrobiota bacterium]
MKVRHFLREMLTTLDEALLRETEDVSTGSPGAASLSGTAAMRQQRVASESAAEDAITLTTPVDIHEDIYALLQPTNRMIYSPHNIEADILRPFLTGEKSITLICSHSRKTLPATLQAAHEHYLVADTEAPLSFRKLDEIVLVVFPVAPQQHYVMQTSIRALYAFRLELEYHDPRSDVRYDLSLAEPVRLHLAALSLVETLAQRQGDLVRQIILPPLSGTREGAGQILDLFCATGETTYTTPPLAETPPLEGTLRDISLGGVGIAVDESTCPEIFVHRLVLLSMHLPSLAYTLPKWARRTLHYQMLGVVRGVKHTASDHTIHVRFLHKLPQDMETLLRSLARCAAM